MVLLNAWPYFAFAAGVYMCFRLKRKDYVLLVAPAYCFHQFEEHGIDFMGHHYSFRAFLCHALPLETCPADSVFIFVVNCVAVNLAAFTAWHYRARPAVAACSWGIPFVNIFGHVVPALKYHAYNPGLVTALVLFLPGSIYVISKVVKELPASLRLRFLTAVVLAGVLVHFVIIATVMSATLPYPLFQLINGLNGLVPATIGCLFFPAKLKY